MEMLHVMERLFKEHTPETLLALFGVATSLLLLSLLRSLFGFLTRSAIQEAGQEQAVTALMESLVGALVSEAGHLRQTLDHILDESVRRSQQNARVLSVLLARTERLPADVVQLLKPELEGLSQELKQSEARIISQAAATREEQRSQSRSPSPTGVVHAGPEGGKGIEAQNEPGK